MNIRIGTRGSDLALWQARTVRGWLEAEPGVEVEIVVLKTKGDAIDHVPLQQVEGKGFFTAEIERALLDRAVDVAVHSHKDLATENPPGLEIVGVPLRGPVAERLLVRPEVHDPGAPILPLASGARVGTSAPRRAEQLRALRPDLEVQSLRGNVPTRVRRLREGRHDAIVLAAAGLERLALDTGDLCVFELPVDRLVPAPAQGALAIQIRADDAGLRELVQRRCHDPRTADAVAAERRVLQAAGGGCSLPLGALIVPAEDGSYAGRAFLGADHPQAGAPARWATARGDSPAGVASALVAVLEAGTPTGAGPLSGRRVALCGSGRADGALGRRLAELGAEVLCERAIATEDLPAPERPRRAAALRPGDVLAVTSRRAAERLAGLKVAEGVVVAAVGPATARSLASAGLAPHVVGAGGAAELAGAIPLEPGARVLFPCAEDARPDLPAILAERGAEVESLPIYRTLPAPSPELGGAVDVRVYMSPSAVRAAAARESDPDCAPRLRLALGSATWEALQAEELEALPADGSGPEAAIRALLARWSAPLEVL